MRGGRFLDARSEGCHLQVCRCDSLQKLWVVAAPLCGDLTFPVPQERGHCPPAALVGVSGHGIPSSLLCLLKFLPVTLCCSSSGQLAQGLPLGKAVVDGWALGHWGTCPRTPTHTHSGWWVRLRTCFCFACLHLLTALHR